jgi:GSH-dependent disulfide-bond oxidoreductase
MNDSAAYAPPKVWIWNKPSGGRFASINRPVAGATHNKDLPVGRHQLQLYSEPRALAVKTSEAFGEYSRRIYHLLGLA